MNSSLIMGTCHLICLYGQLAAVPDTVPWLFPATIHQLVTEHQIWTNAMGSELVVFYDQRAVKRIFRQQNKDLCR